MPPKTFPLTRESPTFLKPDKSLNVLFDFRSFVAPVVRIRLREFVSESTENLFAILPVCHSRTYINLNSELRIGKYRCVMFNRRKAREREREGRSILLLALWIIVPSVIKGL